MLPLDLLGLGVSLLLPLLATAKELSIDVNSALSRELLEKLGVLELVPGEDQALLNSGEACTRSHTHHLTYCNQVSAADESVS